MLYATTTFITTLSIRTFTTTTLPIITTTLLIITIETIETIPTIGTIPTIPTIPTTTIPTIGIVFGLFEEGTKEPFVSCAEGIIVNLEARVVLVDGVVGEVAECVRQILRLGFLEFCGKVWCVPSVANLASPSL